VTFTVKTISFNPYKKEGSFKKRCSPFLVLIIRKYQYTSLHQVRVFSD